MERFIICTNACDALNAYDSLEKIQCPVLVLGSGEDGVLSLDASVKIADKLKSLKKNVEFYIYEGYGHAAVDELPEYKTRIFQFLQKQILNSLQKRHPKIGCLSHGVYAIEEIIS